MNKPIIILLMATITLGIAKIFETLGSKYDIFIFAFIYSFFGFFVISFMRPKKIEENVNRKSIKWGFVIGIVNIFCVFFILMALKLGPAAKTFPINSLSVIPAMIFSWIYYKERLSWKGYVGIAFAIVAILLLK